ncbi:MAG: radical SAM protein [Alphaproteobacteria bacterium]|nr:radical SAM protein [Alphaproteobacteria bacterium]
MTQLEAPAKFADPDRTAKGEPRAAVALRALETLWFNTGTLCNITCAHCYIESSPRNDRLAYLSLEDVRAYLDEIERDRLPVRLIGFTGGEPFMNPLMIPILEETLARGFQTLVLTNAMRPMMRRKAALLALNARYGVRLRLRISLDDPRPEVHDAERGEGGYAKTLAGLRWLAESGFAIDVAGRHFVDEDEDALREAFRRLFTNQRLPVDADDPAALVIFPEMAPHADPPEITEACWGLLNKSPDDVMCATARMVVRRKNAAAPVVLACTLLPYEAQFELGATLAEASRAVPLNHKYCASFCVLGGASCGAAKD